MFSFIKTSLYTTKISITIYALLSNFWISRFTRSFAPPRPAPRIFTFAPPHTHAHTHSLDQEISPAFQPKQQQPRQELNRTGGPPGRARWTRGSPEKFKTIKFFNVDRSSNQVNLVFGIRIGTCVVAVYTMTRDAKDHWNKADCRVRGKTVSSVISCGSESNP